MADAIAKFGSGFKPSSMHELRTWILKEDVDDVSTMMKEHKKAWKKYVCSIMLDDWTYGNSRYLINCLVNSPIGIWFLKSIDTFDSIKNGELMFAYLVRWLKKLVRRMLCKSSLIMRIIM